MVQLKIVKVGNSLGVRLPREVLNRMHLGDGDKLILTEAPEGGYRLSSYDPEFANNYEIGIKTSMFDDRVRFNATGFYVNYEDFQRSTVVSVPGTAFQETRTFNAAEVDAYGLEFELTALLCGTAICAVRTRRETGDCSNLS